jgi:hypothetical protein
VNEVEYISGYKGAIVYFPEEGRWRILQDPRPENLRPTFATRQDAALDEWHIAEREKAACQQIIEKWAMSGISIQRLDFLRWTWSRPGENRKLPEFRSLGTCVADLKATLISTEISPEIQAIAEGELINAHRNHAPADVLWHTKIRLPKIWAFAVKKAIDQCDPTRSIAVVVQGALD